MFFCKCFCLSLSILISDLNSILGDIGTQHCTEIVFLCHMYWFSVLIGSRVSFLLFMLNLWVLLRRVEAMMMRTIVRLAPFLWRTDWPIPYRSQKRIWSRNISLFHRSTAEHGQGIYNISEEETLSNLFPHRNMEYLLMFHLDVSNLNFSYEITIRST